MLTGNNYHDCNRYNRLEMKNVNKDIVAWLEDIVEENNSHVERKEWKSKYNSYVVYDYEPFCTDGFEINLVITSYDQAYLNFIKYLYEEKVSTIEYLNSCIGQWLRRGFTPAFFVSWSAKAPVVQLKPIILCKWNIYTYSV